MCKYIGKKCYKISIIEFVIKKLFEPSNYFEDIQMISNVAINLYYSLL